MERSAGVRGLMAIRGLRCRARRLRYPKCEGVPSVFQARLLKKGNESPPSQGAPGLDIAKESEGMRRSAGGWTRNPWKSRFTHGFSRDGPGEGSGGGCKKRRPPRSSRVRLFEYEATCLSAFPVP